MEDTVLESLFDKIVGLKVCNLTKIRVQRMCFPVKLAKCLKNMYFEEQLHSLGTEQLNDV